MVVKYILYFIEYNSCLLFQDDINSSWISLFKVKAWVQIACLFTQNHKAKHDDTRQSGCAKEEEELFAFWL